MMHGSAFTCNYKEFMATFRDIEENEFQKLENRVKGKRFARKVESI